MVRYTKKKDRYCQIFERTMRLWGMYGEEYRNILKEYESLLQQKRDLKVKPIGKIKDSSLREFPIINFLYLDDEKKAEEYLLNLTESQLKDLMADIDLYVDGKLRRDLLARITDYKQQIRLKKNGKSMYAIDPDSCGCGKKCSLHKEREYRY
jgi:hypothetical protein